MAGGEDDGDRNEFTLKTGERFSLSFVKAPGKYGLSGQYILLDTPNSLLSTSLMVSYAPLWTDIPVISTDIFTAKIFRFRLSDDASIKALAYANFSSDLIPAKSYLANLYFELEMGAGANATWNVGTNTLGISYLVSANTRDTYLSYGTYGVSLKNTISASLQTPRSNFSVQFDKDYNPIYLSSSKVFEPWNLSANFMTLVSQNLFLSASTEVGINQSQKQTGKIGIGVGTPGFFTVGPYVKITEEGTPSFGLNLSMSLPDKEKKQHRISYSGTNTFTASPPGLTITSTNIRPSDMTFDLGWNMNEQIAGSKGAYSTFQKWFSSLDPTSALMVLTAIGGQMSNPEIYNSGQGLPKDEPPHETNPEEYMSILYKLYNQQGAPLTEQERVVCRHFAAFAARIWQDSFGKDSDAYFLSGVEPLGPDTRFHAAVIIDTKNDNNPGGRFFCLDWDNGRVLAAKNLNEAVKQYYEKLPPEEWGTDRKGGSDQDFKTFINGVILYNANGKILRITDGLSEKPRNKANDLLKQQ